MEPIIPNQLFNHQVFFLLEKMSQTMRQKVMLLLMFVFICANISAQGGRPGPGIPFVVKEVNAYFASIGSTTQLVSQSATLDAQNLKSLITKVQPSIYFYSGIVKTYGDKPKNLFTEINSLGLVEAVTLKNNIEIVTIRIDDPSQLNTTVDLALFSNFKNLKYIYFISNVATTTSDAIARMINNYDEKYSIFYKIDKGDTNQ